ncbi:hypothetical protein R3I94_022537 [Phoxinus phoxinus]
MVKRCSYGSCNTDSRYPERLGNVQFHPFPKPARNLEKCMKWIGLCGRGHQLSLDKLSNHSTAKHIYVCSKHFVDGRPTPAHPDPLPALTDAHGNVKPARRCSKFGPKLRPQPVPPRKILRVDRMPDNTETISVGCDLQDKITTGEIATESLMEDTTTEESTPLTETECTDDQPQMEEKREQMEEKQEELERLKTLFAQKENENDLLRAKIRTCQAPYPLTAEVINNSSVPDYFRYCTGFTYDEFNKLCRFFRLPDNDTVPQTHIPLTYEKLDRHIQHMPLRQQFLLVLMRLRQNFDLKELAFKFQIDMHSVSTLFSSWIDFLYDRLGVSVWPHRDIITENMPGNYKSEFPTTFAILDCTEIKIEKPSSLLVQSQTYSNKSTDTLKSLIVCDPRGSIMFASTLYSGSISDQELFRRCEIKDLLKGLLQCGYLKKGDGLMVDKGFLIENDVKELGLNLNIPPFAKSNLQTPVSDVEMTKKIAKHRVHVERAIAKVKQFKIVSGRIPNSMLGNINQIWFVVCMLSNFQQHIIQA